MILFINACVREQSRTKRIAAEYLSRLGEPYEEVDLVSIDFPGVDEDFLRWRDECITAGDFTDSRFDLAKQFLRADKVVIAAPLWDLSFPASLKRYFEQINVLGLVFHYGEHGEPISHCHIESLTYISTSGGPDYVEDYGYGYAKALAETFYGIKKTALIQAAGLDVEGADVEAILKDAFAKCARID